jgi:hypothetical protein
MKVKIIGIICLLILGGILTLRMGESDDPLTGIWTGTWGPTPIHRMDVTVELKWDGKDTNRGCQFRRAGHWVQEFLF